MGRPVGGWGVRTPGPPPVAAPGLLPAAAAFLTVNHFISVPAVLLFICWYRLREFCKFCG